jgi:hypothetical protein
MAKHTVKRLLAIVCDDHPLVEALANQVSHESGQGKAPTRPLTADEWQAYLVEHDQTAVQNAARELLRRGHLGKVAAHLAGALSCLEAKTCTGTYHALNYERLRTVAIWLLAVLKPQVLECGINPAVLLDWLIRAESCCNWAQTAEVFHQVSEAIYAHYPPTDGGMKRVRMLSSTVNAARNGQPPKPESITFTSDFGGRARWN